MAFGFPAYSVGSQKYNLSRPDLTSVVGESMDRLGWRYERPSPNMFVARNTVNPWSWGEKIAVEISDEGVLTAKSECLLVTQCLDWGKNRRNVRAFFAEVSRGVSAREALRSPVASSDEESLTPVERVIKGGEKERR
jgi:hypothetical protein